MPDPTDEITPPYAGLGADVAARDAGAFQDELARLESERWPDVDDAECEAYRACSTCGDTEKDARGNCAACIDPLFILAHDGGYEAGYQGRPVSSNPGGPYADVWADNHSVGQDDATRRGAADVLASIFGRAPVILAECGGCSGLHRDAYHGDCRNDAERFYSEEDFTERTGAPVAGVYVLDHDGNDEPVFVPEPTFHRASRA